MAPHEGKRKSESIWPILRIHHQRSRYIYEAFYKKHEISREVYDYCVREGHADANLIAKWRKPGYGSLCCLGCSQTKDHNFGTSCICRVPKVALDAGRAVECTTCGCRGCAGGDERFQIIDVAATVEARGGLPLQTGYAGTRAPPPPAPAASAGGAAHSHPASSGAGAAAAAAAAAPLPFPLPSMGAPPGFFPTALPPEALQAMLAAQAATMAQFMASSQGQQAGGPPPAMPPPHVLMMMMAAAAAGGGGMPPGMMMPPMPPGMAMPLPPPGFAGFAPPPGGGGVVTSADGASGGAAPEAEASAAKASERSD